MTRSAESQWNDHPENRHILLKATHNLPMEDSCIELAWYQLVDEFPDVAREIDIWINS